MTWGQIRLLLTKFAPAFDLELITAYVNGAYEQILEDVDYKALEQDGIFSTVAIYETGTIDVTAGSDSITRTVGAAQVFTAAMSGRRIRIATENTTYLFTQVSDIAGQLDRDYEGSTATGLAYRIWQNIYALPEQVNWVDRITSEYLPTGLGRETQAAIAAKDPAHLTYGDPIQWAAAPDTDQGNPPVQPQIEVWPIPLYARALRYYFQGRPIGFDGSNTDYSPLPVVPAMAIIDLAKSMISLDLGDQMASDRWALAAQRIVSKAQLSDRRKGGPVELKMPSRYTRHYRERWQNTRRHQRL